MNLLLIEEEGKIHYALIKDFNTFINDHHQNEEENIFVVIVVKLSVPKKY